MIIRGVKMELWVAATEIRTDFSRRYRGIYILQQQMALFLEQRLVLEHHLLIIVDIFVTSAY